MLKRMMERGILISGAAGQGVQTVGAMLSRMAAGRGLAVFSWQDNESRIRGGANAFLVRISETVRNAPCSKFDVVLPLDGKSRIKYGPLLTEKGVIVGPADASARHVAVPFDALSTSLTGSGRSANAAALGALASVLGFPIEAATAAVAAEFAGKPESLVRVNSETARAGFNAAAAVGPCFDSFPAGADRPFLISGADAAALGAWAAGCRFIAAYPMSPSTGVITTLARESAELGVLAEQAEDEIAAVNMAIGASFAGIRAMTATSGGGFALMTESVSLAGMTETPLVILIAQRPGPATGLPTRTEQADLLFAIHSGHGEFPKAVLAPHDAKSAFHAMARAFDLAERFQTPVFVLTDQFLMDSAFTVEDFETAGMPRRTPPSETGGADAYRRYALTESGISPRLAPKPGGPLVCCDSDEHDEEGHITEDLRLRKRMVEKRIKKGAAIRAEAAAPEAYRMENAETGLVTWGTTRNAAAEAVDRLRAEGKAAGLVHFREIWPLPAFRFPGGIRWISVEGNATGQMEGLIRAEYGVAFESTVRRFDGLPLDADTILEGLR
jgi:2-oxoglutarate/2-oxoacid ferredoxin oxidoreductase subunit alpha